jgi:membrane associated rhomboid family serine protease
MASLARVIFLAFGIFVLFMAIVSGVYSYFYFQGHLQSPDGPLVIFQVTMICTVLGLIGGLAIGTYVEAWRANKGQRSLPP